MRAHKWVLHGTIIINIPIHVTYLLIQEKLVVCALYLLFGMALIAMCFKLMQDDVVQKARWLGQKIGILGRCTYGLFNFFAFLHVSSLICAVE